MTVERWFFSGLRSIFFWSISFSAGSLKLSAPCVWSRLATILCMTCLVQPVTSCVENRATSVKWTEWMRPQLSRHYNLFYKMSEIIPRSVKRVSLPRFRAFKTWGVPIQNDHFRTILGCSPNGYNEKHHREIVITKFVIMWYKKLVEEPTLWVENC